MQAFKKAVDVVTTVLFVLVIIVAFLLVGVRIFGLTPYTVLSGSMEPEYHVGSLIYVKNTSAAELDVGDPVTYKVGSTVVTHRIIEVIVNDNDPTDVSYRTQGDANDTPDGDPVHISQVIGKPVFDIPLLGYVAYYVRTPVGIGVTVSVIVLLLVLTFLPDLIRSILQDTKTDETKKELSEERAEVKRLIDEISVLRARADGSDAPEAHPADKSEGGSNADKAADGSNADKAEGDSDGERL